MSKLIITVILMTTTAELNLLTVRTCNFSEDWIGVLEDYLFNYGSKGGLLTFESPSELTDIQIGE